LKRPAGKPVVGFHSFGNKYRWPKDRSSFNSLYVSSTYETRFYGQVKPAMEAFGADVFSSADVVNHETNSLCDFLGDIDFWLYYPHPKLCDTVCEPVLTALAAAKVVILPHRLAPLYGAAAVYASVDEVSSIISSFVDRPQAYQEQAERAQSFIKSRYTNERLIQRIMWLIRGEE